MGFLLWLWSNIAFVGALAGLVALWWFHPRRMFTPVSLAFTIALAGALGGFGWGELRYADGRQSAFTEADIERVKIERKLADLETDFRKRESALETQADEAKRDLRDALASQPEGPDPRDAEAPRQLAIANGLIEDLRAQNEELRDRLDGQSAATECLPKIVTRTVRTRCLPERVPDNVIDALEGIR